MANGLPAVQEPLANLTAPSMPISPHLPRPLLAGNMQMAQQLYQQALRCGSIPAW